MAYDINGFKIGCFPADQDMQSAQFQPVFLGAAQNTTGHGQGGAAVSLNTAVTTTANTTSGSAVIAAASTTGLVVGQVVSGAGIPANTTIVSISGGNVTLSANATATASNVAISAQNGGAAGTIPLGILYTTPRLGEAAGVQQNGVSKAKAVGSFNIGDPLYAAPGGVAKAATGSGKFAFARALETAVSGDTTSILLSPLGVQ